MARLKCKNCEQFFELNGTIDINCPHCGVKLENSYTEWKLQRGNKQKTFDDYKKKKCYPSAPSSKSATKYEQKENKASRSHNPYKEILKKRESHKAFLKRVYIISAISGIILLALITNPNVDAHKKAFHEKLFGKSEITVETSLIRKEEIQDSSWKKDFYKHEIENLIFVEDCYLFSLTKITWSKKTYTVGLGFFHHVFITDFVEHLHHRM